MNFVHLRFLRALAALIGIALLTLPGDGAWSQTTNIIKAIVPYPPGGVNDVVARLLGEQIGRAGGPTLVIENRPGAAGVIGTDFVAHAVPDGNTILLASTPFLIEAQLRKVNYDPLTGFEPICDLVNAPTVIVVNSASPYRTLADLLNAARAKPGEVTMSSIGPGSVFHLGFEMLKRAAKVDMTFVPYPGNAPALNAVLGEHVTSMFGTYLNVAEYLKTGQLRALAVATRTRAEPLPEIPTVTESGYEGVDADAWFGAFAPAKTPRDTLSKLEGWFTAAMRASEVREKFVVQGLYPVGMCGADFASYIRDQYEEDGHIIRDAHIKVE